MNKIKTFAFRKPIIISAIVFFLASFLCIITNKVSIAFLNQYMDLRKATWLYYLVYQGLWAIAMLPLIREVGIFETAGFTKLKEWKQVWICWPLIVMGILSGWDVLSGKVEFNTSEPLVFILYLMLNLSIGFYEEIIGRSFVLNLMLQKWGNTKRGIYKAVFISSVLFGVIHLTTVILGKRELIPGIGQVFFTMAFGVFFAACFIRNNSVWPSIFLHAFVDLFASSNGLTANFGIVQQASVINTFINALFSLPLLLCGIFLLRKVKPSVDSQ
jgi:membrane protease YdiL (CAAX protease family)